MTKSEQSKQILDFATKLGLNPKDVKQALDFSPVDLALEQIITQDESTIRLKEKIRKLADKDLNVLILGETGTGKELIAQALHSTRKGPLISVNCGGIVDTLLEADFFGSTKGSYTGAMYDRTGYFEQASEGTLFLDEIAELPYRLQCKLLRVIESKKLRRKIRRLGDSKEIEITCRIISATNNLDLKTRLGRQKSNFREDLYFRLAGTILETKPLRERPLDIPLICKHFDKDGMCPVGAWMDYPFEGNVRELINLINEYLELL